MKRLLLALLLLCPAYAAAQPSDCSDGVIYDDGFFESGDGLNETNVARGGLLQLVEAPSYPATIRSLCVCWIRSASDTSVSFDVAAWEYDAIGRVAGRLLGVVPGFVASEVPTLAANGRFYRVELGNAITITGPTLVGPIWRPRQDREFFLCADRSAASNKLRLQYITGSPTDELDHPIGPVNLATLTYALGIRPVFGAATGCVPSTTRLCLNRGRFAVEATFTTSGAAPGTSQVVKLTDETGYLWFFNANNVEVVVKVLDACGLNDRFWVFAGGLTDVNVVLTVTDTQTGNVKTYTNPQGTAFRPIQDTNALPCQ